MSDPCVRSLGELADMDGQILRTGVDYDTVTISLPGILLFRLTGAQAEEFAQLFVSAVWQAGQQKARMDGDVATEARHEAIDRAEAFRDEAHGWTGP